jgi:signal transduction histidine kinase
VKPGLARRMVAARVALAFRVKRSARATSQPAFDPMVASLEGTRDELAQLAAEQGALRRVATLVAQGLPPAEVFTAVAAEVGLLFSADVTHVIRREPDGTVTVAAGWSPAGDHMTAGMRLALEGESTWALVARTERVARMDSYEDAPGPVAANLRELGIRSSVTAPIFVDGRLWGAIAVSSRGEPVPAGTESWLENFAELVATAVANADAHTQLVASRARVVAAADEARRRIERDLHDGLQQRLVSLGLDLRAAQSMLPPDLTEAQAQVGRIAAELDEATDELREISRGIHPAILSEGGLAPALRTLARRSAVPVELDLQAVARLPAPVEVAAYYVVSEALANSAKHAQASVVHVGVEQRDGLLRLAVRDDGVGGADPANGSGLTGLRDRVEALGGTIAVESRKGGGTAVTARLPVRFD